MSRKPSPLALFRLPGECEWCGQWGAREPHHYYYRKNMGGGGHIDHPYNIVALCRRCHDAVHRGDILRCDLLAVVAARESTTQDRIVDTLNRLRRGRK